MLGDIVVNTPLMSLGRRSGPQLRCDLESAMFIFIHMAELIRGFRDVGSRQGDGTLEDSIAVLVIEDDQLIQTVVSETLNEGNFNPAIAASGEEAVTLKEGQKSNYRALVGFARHSQQRPGRDDERREGPLAGYRGKSTRAAAWDPATSGLLLSSFGSDHAARD